MHIYQIICQDTIMRLLGPLVFGCVLLPVQACTRPVKLADISGSWTRSDTTIDRILVFKADSTTNWASPSAVTAFHPIARLGNDTIRFLPRGRDFRITRKGQELIVSTDQAANGGFLKAGEFRFKRVQIARARAQSFKLADIVGSWTRSDTAIGQILIFRADSTTNWANPEAVAAFHPITRLSNDSIQFLPRGRTFRIALKGRELIVSTDQPARTGNGNFLNKGEFRFERTAVSTDSSPMPPVPLPGTKKNE